MPNKRQAYWKDLVTKLYLVTSESGEVVLRQSLHGHKPFLQANRGNKVAGDWDVTKCNLVTRNMALSGPALQKVVTLHLR